MSCLLKRISGAACLAWLVATGAHAAPPSFAVIGDTPYSDFERRELPHLLDLIADDLPAFIIHAGDIKKSSAPCSDEILIDRRDLFDAARVPFIYTPGDNEWTDCTGKDVGNRRSYAAERLHKLRELFFARPESLGQTRIALERQSPEYPEHQRWRLGPVLFLTLNVPGPDNNFGRRPHPSDEFVVRNPVVLDWLRQGFALARQEQRAGIVIVMQGNPGFKHFAAGFADGGYRQLLETLRRETLVFPGQVLLVHGDTHWNRIDQPLFHPRSTQPVANFTRVETFGYPFMGWVKVTIDTNDPALFRFDVFPYAGR
ncbi:MAG: hypothetical protein ABI478_08795 [Propionivibrio sp.]